MACTACQRRREAMLRRARTIEPRSPVKPYTVVSQACAGCTSRVTPNGWINVCPICYAKSEPKPTPHTELPKCLNSCARLK